MLRSHVRALPIALSISSCGTAQSVTAPQTQPLVWDAANAALYTRVVANASAREAEWIELRRDLYRHPGLSRQEQRTSAIVADRLRALGLDDAGAFSTLKPSAIFGIHTSPGDTGQITSRAGRMMNANALAPGVINEDFGHFQAQVPGVFFFLGASNRSVGVASYPHSPGFALDERAILFGVRAMAAAVLGV